MPIQLETDERFGPHSYDEVYFRGHEARYAEGIYASRQTWIEEYLPEAMSGLVLDAGPGIGVFTREVEQRGAGVIALDFSPVALGAVGRSSSRAARVLGDVLAMPFATASFRWILAFDVLEHLYAPTRFLREVHRTLEPGGTCFLLTDNAKSISRWKGLRRLFGVLRARSTRHRTLEEIRGCFDSPSCHVAIYTTRELLAMVREAGLNVRRYDTFPRIAGVWMERALRAPLVRSLTRGFSGGCVILEARKE